MRAMISKVFLNHPSTVDESYLEHMQFAGSFSLKLFAAAFAALIHAFIPCLFEKTASNLIRQMYSRINNR